MELYAIFEFVPVLKAILLIRFQTVAFIPLCVCMPCVDANRSYGDRYEIRRYLVVSRSHNEFVLFPLYTCGYTWARYFDTSRNRFPLTYGIFLLSSFGL